MEGPLGAMLGRVYTELLFAQTKKMAKDHTRVHREKGWAEDGFRAPIGHLVLVTNKLLGIGV